MSLEALNYRMPWLSEEIPDWEELTEAEREEYRDLLRDLGAMFPDDENPDEEADYFE